MNNQIVSAVAHSDRVLELTSPTIGTKLMPTDELVTLVEKATEALELLKSQKPPLPNPTTNTLPNKIDIMNKPAENVDGTAEAPLVTRTDEAPLVTRTDEAPLVTRTDKAPLTYRGIIFQVLREANKPLTAAEVCLAAEPLIKRMNAKGKTPMASLKSKLYVAAKNGDVLRVDGDKFCMPPSLAA
jgi:hypothetical protein